jgi:hypothetical protein
MDDDALAPPKVKKASEPAQVSEPPPSDALQEKKEKSEKTDAEKAAKARLARQPPLHLTALRIPSVRALTARCRRRRRRSAKRRTATARRFGGGALARSFARLTPSRR